MFFYLVLSLEGMWWIGFVLYIVEYLWIWDYLESVLILKNWYLVEFNGEGCEKCVLVKKKMVGGVIIFVLESFILFVKENKREIIMGKSG